MGKPCFTCYNSSTLAILMLRLLSSKAQGCKDFRKSSKPCHVGIHWKALEERLLVGQGLGTITFLWIDRTYSFLVLYFFLSLLPFLLTLTSIHFTLLYSSSFLSFPFPLPFFIAIDIYSLQSFIFFFFLFFPFYFLLPLTYIHFSFLFFLLSLLPFPFFTAS